MNDDFKFQIPIRNKDGVIIKYTIVDEEDYGNVSKYTWCFGGNYVKGYVDKKPIYLHHFVLNKPSEQNVIDHKNGNKLDNRKCNLRETNKSFNSHNKSKNLNIDASSKYKGVSLGKCNNKFRAKSSGKCLGYYNIEEDAAKAYDTFTYIKFGEFANNNKLVNYEDVKHIDIKSFYTNKRKHNLPKHIYTYDNKFFCKKMYKSQQYNSLRRETLKETIIDLIEINHKINKLKLIEQIFYHLKPIKRNKDGIAIIKIKDIEVLVDDNVWHKCSKIFWRINHDGYITGHKNIGMMHRYLIGNVKTGEIVDHINNIRYDNRISNLRIVSSTDNCHNRTKQKNTSSQYIGVSFRKPQQKWHSNISYNHKRYYLGSFENEVDAAIAYNDKAIELYGESANLNEI